MQAARLFCRFGKAVRLLFALSLPWRLLLTRPLLRTYSVTYPTFAWLSRVLCLCAFNRQDRCSCKYPYGNANAAENNRSHISLPHHKKIMHRTPIISEKTFAHVNTNSPRFSIPTPRASQYRAAFFSTASSSMSAQRAWYAVAQKKIGPAVAAWPSALRPIRTWRCVRKAGRWEQFPL